MKLVFAIVIALAFAGSALAAPKTATLTIRHQTHGCHSWSFNSTTWTPSQKITLARGASLKIVDNDVMSHTLIQSNARTIKAAITGAAMKRMGATAHVVFSAKGTYIFTTKPGEDYMKGIKTIGEDNVLKLVVTVV